MIAAAQTRAHPGTEALKGGHLSFLEKEAVSGRGVTKYTTAVNRFILWCMWMGANWASNAELDAVLTGFLCHLALDEYDTSMGHYTIAGLLHYLPGLQAGKKATLPRAHRAMKGWKRLVPPQMRLPIPKEAVLAVCGWMMAQGQPAMAVFLYMTFDAYLRPGEAYKLQGRSLVRPSPFGRQGHGHWGLIINDADSGHVSKTGVSDEAIIIDNPVLYPALEALAQARSATDCLWIFTPQQVRDSFAAGLLQLGMGHLSPCLYTLRHGGASYDLLRRQRPMKVVKARGRWISDQSLRRYGKATRMQQRTNALRPETVAFADEIEKNFAGLLELSASGRFPLVAPTVHNPQPFAAEPVKPALTRRWTYF